MAPLDRRDLIREILPLYENPAYLEIGYGNGDCFDLIQINNKTCVDPNPVESSKFGQEGIAHKMKSDEFFSINKLKYDVIFIDGDHCYAQVAKDLNNAKKFLKPNGCIIMHDCGPLDKDHIVPSLCGDGGYRLLTEMSQMDTDVYWMTSFEDYGTCIVRFGARKGIKFDNPDDSYGFFDKNRPLILNLKPMVEIIEETKSSILKGITNEK